MMVHVIGLGEYWVSNKTEDSIKTYALASCVGLVVYNPGEKILGMVHIVLPDTTDNEDAKKGEGFFAQTAVPLLFKKVFGGYPEPKTLYRVTLFGGCHSRKEKDMFQVGERNVARIEQILTENSIYYDKRNTGGFCSRTIEAYVRDGSIAVKTQDLFL